MLESVENSDVEKLIDTIIQKSLLYLKLYINIINKKYFKRVIYIKCISQI